MFGKLKRSYKGQGVVEYSGALVIAVAVVVAGLIVAPPNLSELFETIYASTTTMLLSHLS
ncbi:hypothetical protein [Vampirovibrio sp.]|uniref:hypothetical protein n=1 Tax=Vampirovibrio sp. TaxID=2717857 RepID=UPI003593C392